MVRGGFLIKQARTLRGFTQQELADMYGVSLKSIQRWECYAVEPKFCDVYAVVTQICKLDFAKLEEQLHENH